MKQSNFIFSFRLLHLKRSVMMRYAPFYKTIFMDYTKPITQMEYIAYF
jgi:hypothetical protein